MQGVGLLILRVVLGLTFFVHGLPKLVTVWGTGPRESAALFETAGIEPAYPIAVGSGLVELLGGILLVAGGYIAWTAVMLAITTGVLAWKLYLPHGFFINWAMTPDVGHGYEQALLLLGALVCLLLCGPGRLSVDRRRARLARARKLSREVQRAGAK